jgi:hypothetical protein
VPGLVGASVGASAGARAGAGAGAGADTDAGAAIEHGANADAIEGTLAGSSGSGTVSMKKGRWSKQEDAELVRAVAAFSAPNWRMICTMVPTRTDVQCRERYMNCLQPMVNKAKFTPQEDVLLEEAVLLHGSGSWSLVSEAFNQAAKARLTVAGGGAVQRTDNQIARRHVQLHPERKVELAKQRRVKGKVMHNFSYHHSKEHRQQLGPNSAAFAAAVHDAIPDGPAGGRLDTLTVEELKAELAERGLNKLGNKAVLLSRLKLCLAGTGASASTGAGAGGSSALAAFHLNNPPQIRAKAATGEHDGPHAMVHAQIKAMPQAALKQALVQAGLAATGRKAAMAARLTAHAITTGVRQHRGGGWEGECAREDEDADGGAPPPPVHAPESENQVAWTHSAINPTSPPTAAASSSSSPNPN